MLCRASVTGVFCLGMHGETCTWQFKFEDNVNLSCSLDDCSMSTSALCQESDSDLGASYSSVKYLLWAGAGLLGLLPQIEFNQDHVRYGTG